MPEMQNGLLGQKEMIGPRIKYAIKKEAKKIYGEALRKGDLKRPKKCSACGIETRIDGHHDDYLKPLFVMWLCQSCHHARHKKFGFQQIYAIPKSEMVVHYMILRKDVKNSLKKIAKREGRSLASHIRLILEKSIL